MGNYKNEYFQNEAVISAKREFKEELKKIEEKISKRNENLEIPYTVLLPSRVPISIAI